MAFWCRVCRRSHLGPAVDKSRVPGGCLVAADAAEERVVVMYHLERELARRLSALDHLMRAIDHLNQEDARATEKV